jgi:chromosome segregation ATPase
VSHLILHDHPVRIGEMTDFNLDNPSLDDEQPIAMRRKRRNIAGPNSRSRSNARTAVLAPHGMSTPPATPKRAKKRVRFSDPGPALESESASSGLTPFIRRTSLSTPTSKRRHSTPAKLWNLAEYDTPVSGTLQFEPLRQVLDGRVKRRIRRNRLSEEVNTIEGDKRHEAKARRSEVEKLREQLAAKDLEVQSLRDDHDIASQIEGESGTTVNTTTTLSTKVQELEQQIVELKAELQRKEVDAEEDDPNWTLVAKDPFNFEDEDEMITSYDREFTTNDELMTTPTRLNTSFPSPPSTMPNTPCKSSSVMNAGIQASLPVPDPERDSLKVQLEALQLEISNLNSAIALNSDNHSRLASKLSDYIPVDEFHDYSALDSALDSVLTQLALSQSLALENENAFSALSKEITSLGFSTSGPEETLEIIAQQFRQARLELEYATPGEVTEGFENSKLLEMLVSRLHVLVEKVKERDDSIDQYHEQELLLRQQLNTRVDAQHDIQRELYLANSVVHDLRTEVDEKEISNVRLQRALDGYRAEVKGLETLIENLEQEGNKNEGVLRDHVKEVEERLQVEILRHDITKASEEGKEMIIVELERRLNAALGAAAKVQEQMAQLASSTEVTITEKDSMIEHLKSASKSHGDALALRDARVSELREEIERVNEALKTAHSTIVSLRKDNKELEAQIEGEKNRGQHVIQAMQEQLNRVMETGMGYINGDVSVQRSRRGSAPPTIGDSEPPAVVRRGRFLDGDLARRSSGKKRRRYDSGLGFLEEEDEASVLMSTEI